MAILSAISKPSAQGASRALSRSKRFGRRTWKASAIKPNLIALVVDQKMFPPAAFLATRLAALNPRDDIEIAIFSDSVTDLEQAKAFGVPATMVHATLPSKLKRAPVERISAVSFLRLFVPELVEPSIRRIMYLDADVYIEDDRLFGLFDLDMDGYAVAAVRDVRFLFRSEQKRRDADLLRARVSATDYLNGGMLLIDRQCFVDEKIGSRAFRIASKDLIRVDLALNRTLSGKWLQLSPVMNTPMDFSGVLSSAGYKPAVTHFIGEIKPWFGPRFAAQHPARKAIEGYLGKSPWRKFLSNHYSFELAWDALQRTRGGATVSAAPTGTRFDLLDRVDRAAVQAYLQDSEFADVEQGITAVERPRSPA